ncbi:MAG: oligosaccharide flippase family protein [Lentisphaeria bacterium]|nr:oligosaccharide flippase family protein [Lentisphaeria bacterium]
MKNNLLLSSSIYVLGTFSVQAVNFLVLICFARLMQPDDYGKFAIFVFWCAIMQVIIGMRAQYSINNAYIDFGKEKVFSYSSAISCINLFSFVLFLAGIILFSNFCSKLVGLPLSALILGVLQAFFFYYVQLIVGIYRIEEKPIPYLLYTASTVILDAVISCILVYLLPSDKYLGKAYGSLLATALTGGIAAFAVHKNGNWSFFRKDYVKYSLVFSLPLILHGLASVFNGKVDAWFLMKLKSSGDAGLYSFAGNFGHVIYVLYTACNLAFIPWYYKKKAAEKNDIVKNLSLHYIFIFSLIFLFFLCLIPEVIDLLGTSAYGKAKYYAPATALGFFFNFLYTFPTNYLFYRKKTSMIAVTTCITFFLNFISNYYLIHHFGIYGAMITAALTPFIYLVINYCFAKYVVKDYEIPCRFFLLPGLFMCAAVALYYVLLPFMLLRYGIVLAGVCAAGYYYWKKYKSGEIAEMLKA